MIEIGRDTSASDITAYPCLGHTHAVMCQFLVREETRAPGGSPLFALRSTERQPLLLS